jgi:hypothetical protein
MKHCRNICGIVLSAIFLHSAAALAGEPKANSVSDALRVKADEVHGLIAEFIRTDNHMLLIDARKISEKLYPEHWPKEMTSEAEQMLRVRLDLMKALDSAIDKSFDPHAPENRAYMNVMPPVMPTNRFGVIASGMDPAGITDPVARKAYEEAIALNSKKIAKNNREHRLKMEFDRCVNDAWIFLLNLRNDSPAYARAIQIVEETIKDADVLRKLKKKGIGSSE